MNRGLRRYYPLGTVTTVLGLNNSKAGLPSAQASLGRLLRTYCTKWPLRTGQPDFYAPIVPSGRSAPGRLSILRNPRANTASTYFPSFLILRVFEPIPQTQKHISTGKIIISFWHQAIFYR